MRGDTEICYDLSDYYEEFQSTPLSYERRYAWNKGILKELKGFNPLLSVMRGDTTTKPNGNCFS